MEAIQRILVIDNYDSFTYNLVHLLRRLQVPIDVKRNDACTVEEAGLYSHILISPGPGLPAEAGVVPALLQQYSRSRSILGVCLGMQAILEQVGAPLVNLSFVQHGAQDEIHPIEGSTLFRGLPSPFRIGRYHSWGLHPDVVPEPFRCTAVSKDGYVMAVEHEVLPLYGVQFHPESIMTEYGLEMIKNWLGIPFAGMHD